MPKRTYVDTGVLLSVFRGNDDATKQAMSILDDPDRQLVVSDAVRLEAIPKARYHKKDVEEAFYESIFENAHVLPWGVEVLSAAYNLACRHGIAAMDAIHIAFAIDAGVDEFVSTEKRSKPMYRVTELTMRSIAPTAQP